MVPAGAAVADPDVSDQDVRDAQRAVTSTSGAVANIEVRLAELSTQSQTAGITVAKAGEDYAQAQADLADAQQTAQEAAAQSAAAAEQFESARATLVAIAREAARSGGSMDTVQALLSADGFEDVVARSEALSHVSSRADQAVQTYLASEQVAATLKAQADAAAQAQKTAASDAEAALAAAEQAQSDADSAVAAAQAERQSLIVQLAAARNTSAEVEQQRQDQIDAERQQRAEASAQAERTTVPAVTTPSNPSTPPPATSTPPPTTTTPPPATTTPPPATTTPPPVATPPPAGGGTSTGSTTAAQTAITWAKARIGLPYVWGGTGPNGFDCSGLTQGAWRAAGVNLSRTSRDQYRQVKKVAYSEMREGDLVFWGSNPNDANSVYHVAMYIGNGQIIEAPSPGKTVRISPMRYSNSMAYAGRP